MMTVTLQRGNDFAQWRDAARRLIAQNCAPEDIFWQNGAAAPSLFTAPDMPADTRIAGALTVPRRFIDLAKGVVCHRDSERHSRLYRMLWRLQKTPMLLNHRLDDDVRWLHDRHKAIRRDLHKMHAFVRFRKIGEVDGREAFVSWFEPDNFITEIAAPFFVKRFYGMDWAIITPDRRAIWQDEALSFGKGGSRQEVPQTDVIEDQWRTYYRAIFNPARVKIAAMQSEMPRKYWKNLPEAQCIAPLLADVEGRLAKMGRDAVSAPNRHTDQWRISPTAQDDSASELTTLDDLRDALGGCQKCDLHCAATQAVAGEGPHDAAIMMVGEQPGDQEDLAGRPFVGPAGQLLDRALIAAQLDRSRLFMTNAVKHFKYQPMGKRRVHQTPLVGEINHCRWWLDHERALLKPRLIVTLGATAYRAITGEAQPMAKVRGQIRTLDDGTLHLPTIHPSYILRLTDPAQKAQQYAALVRELAMARDILADMPSVEPV